MRGLPGRYLLLLPLLACASQSLRVVPLEPNGAGALPAKSWVVLIGGNKVFVERGLFTRDSIVGFQGAGNRRYAVSRDSVAFVEERRESSTSPLEVIGWVAGAALVGASLLLIAVMSALE